MCGIAGIFAFDQGLPPERRALERMAASLSHRGPDGYGFFQDSRSGLAHTRLSIIDLAGGWQPIHNEDKSKWIIFNGEIFNYQELRATLEKQGHCFYTNSDTEVIIHLFEEQGEACVEQLNGQFAFAIYDSQRRSLFLARDRVGICPFFYTIHQHRLYFASEIKAIFAADPSILRQINTEVLTEIFTFWSPGGNDSIFQGVKQLPPGHAATVTTGGLRLGEYWDFCFPRDTHTADAAREDEYAQRLQELLIDAVQLRLKADVPVGAYLSGGLDSSAITSLIHHYTPNPLKTFSVTFADQVYDERQEQQAMVRHINADHHTVECTYAKIAKSFPSVIWHTESPILRTAPTPLYLLSGLVRANNYKVVLTGEGADEVLGGYDIFKEAKIRRFISRYPDSRLRPFLLKRLYPYLALSPTRSAAYAREFFNVEAALDDPLYAHRPRWKTTSGTKLFLSPEAMGAGHPDPVDKLLTDFQGKLRGLDYFSQAQYLESKLLLANYLLSSQGERMTMAHSVEGRYPFLDHRVIEFCCLIPPRLKMRVLREKHILRQCMAGLLPAALCRRQKQPYMAPDIASFFGTGSPHEYLDYYLSEGMLQAAGLFNPAKVRQLIHKCGKGIRQGFRENMAFVGILSTQILYDKFIRQFSVDVPEQLANVRVAD